MRAAGNLLKITIIIIKMEQFWFYNEVILPSDADEMATSVGPDQTAPLGAV